MKTLQKVMLACIVTILLAGCSQSNAPTKKGEQAMDTNKDSVPTFKLQDINGDTHSLSDYKGKKVYLKLWASWCPICLSGLEEINDLSMETKDYVVLTMVAPSYKDEQNKEDFIGWFTSLEYKNMVTLLDEDGDYMKKIGVRGYPTSVFINSDGSLSKVQPGHMNVDQINETIKKLE